MARARGTSTVTVDLVGANTEPFLYFHKTREAHDRTIKVTTGALREVQRSAGNDEGGLVNRIVTAAGEPWGATFQLPSAVSTIDATISHLSVLWVAHVYAMFHLFLDDVYGELERWSSVLNDRITLGERTDEHGNVSLETALAAVGGDKSEIEPHARLYRLFEIIRDCAVHRAGLASPALVTIASERVQLRKSIAPLMKNKKARPVTALDIPEMAEGEQILLLPRHSILASEVVYRLAEALNALLVTKLGFDGLVYMAAHHSILRTDQPAGVARPKTPQIAINTCLSNRYRVRLGRDLRHLPERSLKKLDQWKRILKRFNETQADAPP